MKTLKNLVGLLLFGALLFTHDMEVKASGYECAEPVAWQVGAVCQYQMECRYIGYDWDAHQQQYCGPDWFSFNPTLGSC